MKNYIPFILISLVILSCAEIQEKFTLMMRISSDLSKDFNHNQINTAFGFGTEETDNHLTVTFYNFPIDSSNVESFEEMATLVSTYLFGKYPELKDISYVEVRFMDGIDIKNSNSHYIYRKEKLIDPLNIETESI